jgi:two-component system sensor histidine kinase/response regulator
MKEYLISKWDFLKGESNTHSLESRIYNSVCLASIVIIAYNVFFSLALGKAIWTIITSLLLPIQFYLYYLSRFQNKTQLSAAVYIIIIHLFFTYSYTVSAGIAGSSLLSFVTVYFAVLAVNPRKRYLFWTTYHVLVILGLIVWEYYHPDFITSGYVSRLEQFIDLSSTYLVTILLLLACLSYIINNYTIEKIKAEQKSAKLDQLSRTQSRLIHIISHDYRAPLRNIHRYLELLENETLSKEERKLLTADLKQTVNFTSNLLLGLLKWNPEDTKILNLSMDRVNLQEVLSDTLQLYGGIARGKNIKLTHSISHSLEVLVNSEFLELIMRNLLDNAVKFSNDGCHITLKAIQQKEHVQIEVADNGDGIPETIQKEILAKWDEEFTTVSSQGIGLKLAREYALAMKGDLSFKTSSAGSTFQLVVLSA